MAGIFARLFQTWYTAARGTLHDPQRETIMSAINILPRVEIIDGRRIPVIALPDDMDRARNVVGCYSHVGQHSCMALDYYRTCTHAPRRGECDELVQEYRGQPPADTPLRILQRMPRTRGAA